MLPFSALSAALLLAAAAASSVSANLKFTTPDGQPKLNMPAGVPPPYKLTIAADPAPKGEVICYYEAPNMMFDQAAGCKFKLPGGPAELQITPQPVFTQGFKPEVDLKVSCVAKDPADKGAFEKDFTYSLVRDTAIGGVCTAVSDPHVTTFDGFKHDDMKLGCGTLLDAPNLLVQYDVMNWVGEIRMPGATAVRYNGIVAVISSKNGLSYSAKDGTPDQAKLDAAGIRAVVTGLPGLPGYSVQLQLSDGTKITVVNGGAPLLDAAGAPTLDIATGRAFLDQQITIEAPAFLRGKVKGLCGNFDANLENDMIGPDGQPIADPGIPSTPHGLRRDLFRAAWDCTAKPNLFTCKFSENNCPGVDPATHATVAGVCDIAKTKANEPPPPPPPVVEYPADIKPVPEPKAAAPPKAPERDPKLTEKMVAECNRVFSPDPECKDLFLSQDEAKQRCLGDAKIVESLNFTESIRTSYMSELEARTKPIAHDPKHERYVKARECRKKLSLGTNECQNNCSGNGECGVTGCACKQGFSGIDCSIKITKCTKSDKAYVPPAPAPVPAPKETYGLVRRGLPDAARQGRVVQR